MNLRIPFILLLSVAFCDHTNGQSLQDLIEFLQDSSIFEAVANVTQTLQETVAETLETVAESPFIQAVTTATEALVETVANATEAIQATIAESPVGQALANVTEALAPPGLDLDAICDGLIAQIDTITQSIDVPIPEEFADFADNILCTCGFVVSQTIIDLECVYSEQICLPLGDEELCGEPTFGGVYDINPIAADELNSKACFTFVDDTTTLSDLCIEVDHGSSFLGIATLETCEIYALRSDGSQSPCECSICDAPSLQLTFDCSGVDLDEDLEKEFILPDFLNGTCFGAREAESPNIFKALLS